MIVLICATDATIPAIIHAQVRARLVATIPAWGALPNAQQVAVVVDGHVLHLARMTVLADAHHPAKDNVLRLVQDHAQVDARQDVPDAPQDVLVVEVVAQDVQLVVVDAEDHARDHAPVDVVVLVPDHARDRAQDVVVTAQVRAMEGVSKDVLVLAR